MIMAIPRPGAVNYRSTKQDVGARITITPASRPSKRVERGRGCCSRPHHPPTLDGLETSGPPAATRGGHFALGRARPRPGARPPPQLASER